MTVQHLASKDNRRMPSVRSGEAEVEDDEHQSFPHGLSTCRMQDLERLHSEQRQKQARELQTVHGRFRGYQVG